MKSSFIKALIKYLGVRNVRLQSRGLPKGMGQWRKGAVKKIRRDPITGMGGGRVFTSVGGGRSKFLTAKSKVYPTRGAKIGGGVAGAGAVAASVGLYEKKQTPSGAATVGQRQMNVVKQLKKRSKKYMTRQFTDPKHNKPYKLISGASLGPYSKDIFKMAKSGYHTFKAGSSGAVDFRRAHKAAGGKKFKWKGTGKWYSGA